MPYHFLFITYQEDGRIEVEKFKGRDDVLEMIIRDLGLHDSGEYVCRIHNKDGFQERHASISVVCE